MHITPSSHVFMVNSLHCCSISCLLKPNQCHLFGRIKVFGALRCHVVAPFGAPNLPTMFPYLSTCTFLVNCWLYWCVFSTPCLVLVLECATSPFDFNFAPIRQNIQTPIYFACILHSTQFKLHWNYLVELFNEPLIPLAFQNF